MTVQNAAHYHAIADRGVLPVDGMEQALTLANASEYGLHATVYTQDIDRALFLSRRLACGTVAINGFTEGDIKTPFGGYRQSGSLSRDKGTEAMAPGSPFGSRLRTDYPRRPVLPRETIR